jgi:hypothetical protein
MRSRSSFLRGVAWVAASFVISSVASAAPAGRHKPHQAAAPKKAPTRNDDVVPDKPVKDSSTGTGDDRASKPVAPTDVELTDDGAKSEPQTPPPKPDAPAPPTPKPKTKSNEPPAATSDHETAEDVRLDEAIARRDAARLALGRVEVAVSVSADIGSRHFTYSDPVGPLLAPYRLPVAPMASFGMEAYPFASTSVLVLRDLGLRGRVSRAFAVTSETPEGAKLETSWTRFGGELRGRALVPGSHPFELGLYTGADASYFGMSTKGKVAALLPAARSVSLRFGFDTRILVAWRLSLMLGGAYLAVTSEGEIYDRFRKPHVGGVDADFACAIALMPGLEARLTSRYTRYFATFKPVIGDPLVAGGALDQQMQFGLGVRYAH